MADEPKVKTFEDLKNEFDQLSYRVGGLTYEIAQKQKEVDAYYKAMRDVSVEAALLKSKETETKAADTATETPKNES